MASAGLSRPLWRGRTNVDLMTIRAIERAEKLAGFTFVVTQGSYQAGAGDPKSAGTHDKGGAVDFRAKWMTRRKALRMVAALRAVGFAAWLRTPAQGRWVIHVHAILCNHPLLSRGARAQVNAYRKGRNGLANNGPDDGPSPLEVENVVTVAEIIAAAKKLSFAQCMEAGVGLFREARSRVDKTKRTARWKIVLLNYVVTAAQRVPHWKESK